jgi:hypothetical protein
MKKWFVLLFTLLLGRAEGMFPLPQTNVPLKTDVRVKSSRAQTIKSEHSPSGARTAIQRDTTRRVFLSIEVRNMSPRLVKDIAISYRFYELEFERSTGNRFVLTRRMEDTEKFVAANSGRLTIAQLKPLERKTVETEPLETTYRSTQDLTKAISQTKTSGKEFGGYIVEYYVGDQLVKRDASSRRLYEAYLRSIGAPDTSQPLRMNIRR